MKLFVLIEVSDSCRISCCYTLSTKWFSCLRKRTLLLWTNYCHR